MVKIPEIYSTENLRELFFGRNEASNYNEVGPIVLKET